MKDTSNKRIFDTRKKWKESGLFINSSAFFNNKKPLNTDGMSGISFAMMSKQKQYKIYIVLGHMGHLDDENLISSLFEDLKENFNYLHSLEKYGNPEAVEFHKEYSSLIKEVIDFDNKEYEEIGQSFTFMDDVYKFWNGLRLLNFNWQVENINLDGLSYQAYGNTLSGLKPNGDRLLSARLISLIKPEQTEIYLHRLFAKIRQTHNLNVWNLYGVPLSNRGDDYVKCKHDKFYYQNLTKKILTEFKNYGFLVTKKNQDGIEFYRPTLFYKMIYNKINVEREFSISEFLMNADIKRAAIILNETLNDIGSIDERDENKELLSRKTQQYIDKLVELDSCGLPSSHYKTFHHVARHRSKMPGRSLIQR